jgi:hypothetical protein
MKDKVFPCNFTVGAKSLLLLLLHDLHIGGGGGGCY